MDKWVKKLGKLGKKFSVPVPKLRSVKLSQPPILPGRDLSCDTRVKGDVSAPQQEDNLGSGTSAFKNNKAAFLKLADRSDLHVECRIESPDSSPAPSLNEDKEIKENLKKTDATVFQQSDNTSIEKSTSANEIDSTVGTDGNVMADGKQQENINTNEIGISKSAEACPYCNSKEFTKRGTRKNKHQIVQLYECKNEECGRTFTAQDVKGRKFPLNVVIEGMSYYNLGFTLEQSCNFLKQKFNICPEPETLSEWISQYSQLCRYERLRPYAVKMYNPADVVEVVTMAHRQLFRFRYHRAKTRLMLEEEYRNRRLQPLKEFLDNISSVTPHQYFQEGERMSEIRSKFDKADLIVKSKFNYANRLADFVLQAVKDNKQRHEQLQRFFIANDSCTVATEVPVYIRNDRGGHGSTRSYR